MNKTLDFYAQEAETYASRKRDPEHAKLTAFLKRLPEGASILELGCGGGQDSEYMLAQGFNVIPTDGSPQLAAQAEKRLKRPVAVMLFQELEENEAYHGVWARACLLHVARKELPGILKRIHNALKPGGVFFASFKAGEKEGYDKFGRYYNYPAKEWLQQTYEAELWQDIEITSSHGMAYGNEPTEWLYVKTVKGT